jgi:hypothetical protein
VSIMTARTALTTLEAALDQCEVQEYELEAFRCVVWDIRAVMGVTGDIADARLADILWERLGLSTQSDSGGTTDGYPEPTGPENEDLTCSICADAVAERSA